MEINILLLPRDAMHKRGLYRRAVAGYLAGYPSRSCVVSKRLKIWMATVAMESEQKTVYTQDFEWYHFQWPWVILSDLAKYSVKRSIARPICDIKWLPVNTNVEQELVRDASSQRTRSWLYLCRCLQCGQCGMCVVYCHNTVALVIFFDEYFLPNKISSFVRKHFCSILLVSHNHLIKRLSWTVEPALL